MSTHPILTLELTHDPDPERGVPLAAFVELMKGSLKCLQEIEKAQTGKRQAEIEWAVLGMETTEEKYRAVLGPPDKQEAKPWCD